MTQYSVSFYVACSDSAIVADDATLAGQGAIAYNQLMSGQDIKFPTATGFTVIPYKSICYATVAQTVVADSEVEDAVCNETNESSDEGGGK